MRNPETPKSVESVSPTPEKAPPKVQTPEGLLEARSKKLEGTKSEITDLQDAKAKMRSAGISGEPIKELNGKLAEIVQRLDNEFDLGLPKKLTAPATIEGGRIVIRYVKNKESTDGSAPVEETIWIDPKAKGPEFIERSLRPLPPPKERGPIVP